MRPEFGRTTRMPPVRYTSGSVFFGGFLRRIVLRWLREVVILPHVPYEVGVCANIADVSTRNGNVTRDMIAHHQTAAQRRRVSCVCACQVPRDDVTMRRQAPPPTNFPRCSSFVCCVKLARRPTTFSWLLRVFFVLFFFFSCRQRCGRE